VSRQVKLLEDYLGTALFRRLTRALELTSEGQAMLPRVREGLANLASAVDIARARESACALSVVTPPNFAARWLMPRLSRFTAAHPTLELHVTSTQDMVDRRDGADHGAAAELRDDSAVTMVRFGDGRYSGAKVEPIFSAMYVPVCSPHLLRGENALRKPADLRHHTLLHDDTVVAESVRPTWSDWLRSVGITDIDATRGPHFSDAALAMDAAVEGLGVTLAIKELLGAEIRAKRLAVPFDIPAPTDFAYYLVTPHAHAEHRAAGAFRDWLMREVALEKAG
jgi:LysR family glycine cleavage system transcriptional activator